ncbi:MAG: hypothetical protein GVY36_07145 [Verrucomicrobia bacterium]|jgi:hypothetical protein|nr:hypothetical protein [Verrucomicrobiota bacterium]
MSLPQLLRITAAATFFGRGCIYIFADAPFRALFWHQDLMTGPVNFLFGLTWAEYAATSDPWIHFIIKVNGLFFILAAILCFTAKPSAWFQKTVLALELFLQLLAESLKVFFFEHSMAKHQEH